MGFNAFDDFMFSLVPIFITTVFIIVIGFIIFTIVSGIGQWSKNNNSPRLTVPAHVVTKRAHTSGGSGDSSATTKYYVTFQVESGDRIEFHMKATEYGMLAEGDVGMLTFQGTRYIEFDRK